MKYPTIDRAHVEEYVKFYDENPEFSPPLKYYGKTAEEIYEHLTNAGEVFDDRFEEILLTYRNNPDLLTEGTLEIINKLLNDQKLREKIKFVNDGSFLTHRIWGFVDSDLKIRFSPEITYYGENVIGKVNSLKFDTLTNEQRIEWLYDHFDTVWVEILLLRSREEIEDQIDYANSFLWL